MSGYNPGIDEEDDDMLDDGDDSPYASITDRTPNEDMSLQGQADAIAAKPDTSGNVGPQQGPPVSMANPGIPGAAPAQDPNAALKAMIAARMGAVDPAERDRQINSNLITNVGQSLSQLSRGTQAPIANDALYANINSQNREIAAQDQKNKMIPGMVAQAIQARQDKLNAIKQGQANFDTKMGLAAQRLGQGKALRGDALGEKQTKADNDEQEKIGKALNNLTTSGRNALGVASKARTSAQRLLEIVNDPKSTPQDMQSAYNDLNTIVSGGTSSVSGAAHQSYNNIQNDIATALSYITSNPTAVNIPEIKKHVADMTNKMITVSDGVINQNANIVKASHTGWIKKHPEEWQGLLSAASPADVNPATSSGGGSKSAHQPGDLVKVKGKNGAPDVVYKVGSDGDSLEPQ